MVVETLKCAPSDVLLVDDREQNVVQAKGLGMNGIRFKDSMSLQKALRDYGLDV